MNCLFLYDSNFQYKNHFLKIGLLIYKSILINFSEFSEKDRKNRKLINKLKILSLKTRNEPKIYRNGSKNRKPTNKLEIHNFFWKPEMNLKYAETDPKKAKRPTNWKFITFLKTGNVPKICGNGSEKKTGNQPTNWKFITFFKNRKRT